LGATPTFALGIDKFVHTHAFESPVAFLLGILLKELLSDALCEVSNCPVTWSISFVSTALFPGSPGEPGPPRPPLPVIQQPSSTSNLGQLQAPGFSAPPLPEDFSPAPFCPLRPGEQRGNYRAGGHGEQPWDGAGAAPAPRLALAPSFGPGPGLDGEGATCQPVRWGAQRGSGRGAEPSPCPKPRLRRAARYLSPDGTEGRTA